MLKKSLLSLMLLLPFGTSIACTNITMKAEDGTCVVGRTMEFTPPLHSKIKMSERGHEYKNRMTDGEAGMSWKSKYGFVYMDGFGLDLVVDGMNEKGLSFGYLYLPGFTEYAPMTNENVKKGVSYLHFGYWVLSQFDNVDDVKKALNGMVIYDEPVNLEGHKDVTFPLHAIITDKSGKSIVVEIPDGKLRVYDNPLGILTNSPTFDWQLLNLKNYVNLSPYSPDPMRVDGYPYTGTGQGAGSVGLPGDITPPSRFVKMAFLTKTASTVKTAEELVTVTRHILNNVFIPDGLVREKKGLGSHETTQWVVYKDLKNNKLYFNSYAYQRLRMIDLNNLDFSKANPKAIYAMDAPASMADDVTDAMKAGK